MWKIIAMSICVLFSSLMAQEEITISSNYAQFKDPNDSGRVAVEVYITIPIDELEFVEVGEGDNELYRAAYLVKVWLTSSNEDATYQNTDKEPHFVEVQSLDEVTPSTMAVEIVQMSVPADLYDLQIGVIDAVNSNIGIEEYDGIELTVYIDDEIGYSDLELATGGEKAESVESKLVKNGYLVVPNTTDMFMLGKSDIVVYFEIYNLPEEKQSEILPVTIQVLGYGGEVIDSKSFEYVQAASDGCFVGNMSIENMIPATYDLVVRIGSDDEPLQTYTRQISITNEEGGVEVASEGISEILATKIRNEIRLIATDKELELWDQLAATQKTEFLKSFWIRRDPNQDNPVVDNEFRQEFYKRLKTVDERYAHLSTLGRDSDLGRVYLSYGEPDEITNNPMGISSITGFDESTWSTKGAIAWSYDSLGSTSGIAWFVFVDNDGDGVFELFSSNLEGWGKYVPN